ncbi:MAG: glycosyltransferase family 9 protein [Chlamydiales bacterium]|nr:glycosyltransferase family 9 protein [Chlamydiales bacterium]
MRSILIVKTSSIGDVIHTFDVLAYLRSKFPAARIDWVVEKSCAGLVEAHPQIDQVLQVDTRRWRRGASGSGKEISSFLKKLREEQYDLLIDLQGNSKSALITFLARAQEKVGFEWKSLPEKPNWFALNRRYSAPIEMGVRRRNLHIAQAHFKDQGCFSSKPVELKTSGSEKIRLEEILSLKALLRPSRLMICPGSKWKNKQLTEETLTKLVKKIGENFSLSFIFIWSNPEEKSIADLLAGLFPERSASIGDLSLNLWQALMGRISGVVAVDSAALHLCGTSKTPSFSIFGPSSSDYYKPEGERHASFQGSCPYGRTFSKRCPILRTCPTGACIRTLSADALYSSFSLWWKSIGN